ncbi:amidohydrolase family protein [Alteromonas sp. 5E99-2]|uniref:amidohydrolase family protein n=1 Tax=Alteromonas sp. 5E99-2 TaxID=2817683 RepID=UPI001A989745|nr:amidohydrolase family protein [Alteromonas sp. 5E99-2]
MPVSIIDPHIHLFNKEQGQYKWWSSLSKQEQELIARSFTVDDLSLPSKFKLKGVVHIEAGFDNHASWREIQMVETAVAPSSLLLGSIGCVDLTLSPSDFTSALGQLSKQSSFRGVRHILDDDAFHILAHTNTGLNFQLLSKHSLTFELQLDLGKIGKETLNKLCQQIDAAPDLNMVINHGGFPPALSLSAQRTSWKLALKRLSAYPNLCIKCSGWEMNDKDYSHDYVARSVQDVIDIFGERRVMFASNFPLVLFSSRYETYWQNMYDLTKELKLNTEVLLYSNAIRTYGL